MRNCSPEVVIKSEALWKLLHEVFQGKQTSDESQKHSGARVSLRWTVFDLTPSIKTHSCSFYLCISAGPPLLIRALFEHDV